MNNNLESRQVATEHKQGVENVENQSLDKMTGAYFASTPVVVDRPRADWFLGLPWWIVIDCVFAFIVTPLAFALSPAWAGKVRQLSQPDIFQASISLAFGMAISSLLFNLGYQASRRPKLEFGLRCILASACAVGVQLACLYIFPYAHLGRWIIAQTFVYLSTLVFLSRWLAFNTGVKNQRKLLILGDHRLAEWVSAQIQELELPFKVEAVVSSFSGAGKLESADAPCKLAVQNLQLQRIREVIVQNTIVPDETDEKTLRDYQFAGNQVSSASAFAERYFQFVPVRQLTDAWFREIDLRLTHPLYHRIKRIIDLVCACAVGVASSPLMVVAAVLIKFDGGSIFYRQTRVGLNGLGFSIWKLRTMKVDAEIAGAQWAKKGDPRVTRVGRILRCTRLDEVPQVWNVLCGEMSFIGPRPERPEFVEKLQDSIPFYRCRHLVKPGITGWAQINYPYGASLEDACRKLEFDLYYIKNSNLLLDLEILIRTVGSVAKGSR